MYIKLPMDITIFSLPGILHRWRGGGAAPLLSSHPRAAMITWRGGAAVLLRSAALRSFLIIRSTTGRRQSAGSTVAGVEQLERGRRSGGMEEGFVESLDERDELVAGRDAVRLRFAGQGRVGRRVTRLLQRPNLGIVRKDDQRQYAVNLYWGRPRLKVRALSDLGRTGSLGSGFSRNYTAKK